MNDDTQRRRQAILSFIHEIEERLGKPVRVSERQLVEAGFGSRGTVRNDLRWLRGERMIRLVRYGKGRRAASWTVAATPPEPAPTGEGHRLFTLRRGGLGPNAGEAHASLFGSDPMGTRAVARAIGKPPSSAALALRILEREGLAEQRLDGRWAGLCGCDARVCDDPHYDEIADYRNVAGDEYLASARAEYHARERAAYDRGRGSHSAGRQELLAALEGEHAPEERHLARTAWRRMRAPVVECTAMTKAGRRCRALAVRGTPLCYAHTSSRTAALAG